jgi:hypothetical protein
MRWLAALALCQCLVSPSDAQVGVVPPVTVSPGPVLGIYQAPIQNPWNVIVQQVCSGCSIDWSKGTMLVYVLLPGLQAGEVLDVWAQSGIKGAQVYTGRVAVGCGVNVAPMTTWLTIPPPSSVGEDWNSDVRPYLELSMRQAFVVPQDGDYYASFRCYAAVNPPAPTGYLQAMWPHGSILVTRYAAHP